MPLTIEPGYSTVIDPEGPSLKPFWNISGLKSRVSSLVLGGEYYIPASLQTVLDSDEVVLVAQQVLLVHSHGWGTLRNVHQQGTCSRSSLLVSNPQGNDSRLLSSYSRELLLVHSRCPRVGVSRLIIMFNELTLCEEFRALPQHGVTMVFR